jgi:hypothetical protein
MGWDWTQNDLDMKQDWTKMFTHQSCVLLQVFLWITLHHSEPAEPVVDLELVRAQLIQLVAQFPERWSLQSAHNLSLAFFTTMTQISVFEHEVSLLLQCK